MPGKLFVPAQDTSVNAPSYGPATASLLADIEALLGAPAQDPSIQTLFNQIKIFGAQPFVPNQESQSVRGKHETDSPVSIFTFPQNARLWTVQLTYAIASNTAYAGGTTQCSAALSLVSGLELSMVECALGSTAGQSDSNGDRGTWNGLPIAAGDQITLDINQGTTVTGVSQRASCIVTYSLP